MHAIDQALACQRPFELLPETPRAAQGGLTFAGLDALRLVACLSVVIYHYTFRGATHDHFTIFSLPDAQFVTKYGYLGVHLFFVISGFVITLSTYGRKPVEFLISRIVRIYPGFLICMSITFAVMLVFGSPTFHVTVRQWLANVFIVAPVLGQNFVDGAYWSIVCEVVFYAWVVCLKSLSMFDHRVTEVVAIWASISFVDLVFLHSPALSAVFLTKYSGFFCAGMMIYEHFVRRNSKAIPVFFVLVLPLCLVEMLDDIAYHNSYYAGTSFSPVVGAVACLVIIGLVALAVAAPLRIPRRGLIFIAGGITYPLYLLHQNIGYVILNQFNGFVPAWPLLVGTILVLLLLATGVWRYIEKPGQALFISRLRYLALRLAPGTS